MHISDFEAPLLSLHNQQAESLIYSSPMATPWEKMIQQMATPWETKQNCGLRHNVLKVGER